MSKRDGGTARQGLSGNLLHGTEKHSKSVMVWAGSCAGKIFGVKFCRGILRSAEYQDHVKNVCVPELQNLNNGSLDGITWQQDGANIHRAPQFMDYLERTFDGRVLALRADKFRRRGQSWAARSPDLSVPDFALWPILKRKVFQHPRPTTVEELETKILMMVDSINADPDLIRRCHVGVRHRAQMCFRNFGGHLEFMK